MSYVVFVVGSMIEYLGFFLFTFVLFRFRPKKWIGHMIIVSFLMSQFSYITRLIPEIGDLSSFIQLVIMIMVMWILFRIPLYYSVVMTGAGFVFGFAVQGILILLLWGSGVGLIEMQENEWTMAGTQFLSSVIVLSASKFIHMKNWGFDYVPTSHKVRVRVTGINAVLLSVIVFSASAACMSAYLLRFEFANYIVYVSAIFILTLPLFMYYSYRKDEEDAS